MIEKENDSAGLIKRVQQSKPDIVAFSSMTGPHQWDLWTASQIKKHFNLLTIFGGPHPTFFPEMINHPVVDIVCRGEGEQATLELLNCLDKNQPFSHIQNLWFKKDGSVQKNQVRPLIEDLDQIPFVDRELYYQEAPLLKDLPFKRFMTGRGCLYNCTYCFNHALRKLYLGKGKYIRKRSVENVLNEIKQVKEKYKLKVVRFSDDTFILDINWLEEFSQRYKKEIGLPFSALGRPNEINERVVKALKEAGCFYLYFGIESGNQKIRNQVLKRNVSDEQIFQAAGLCKKYGLKFGTYNMIGMPGETLDQAFETIKINNLIKADASTCNVLEPYPGTEIAAYAQELGVLDKNFNVDNFDPAGAHSPLKQPQIKEIENLQKFFYLACKYPWTIPIIKKLIKLPSNFIFDFIRDISFALSRIKSVGVSWKDGLKWGLKLRKKIT